MTWLVVGRVMSWLRHVLAPALLPIAALLVVALAVQTVRLHHAKADLARAKADLVAIKDAQVTATKQWQDAVQHQEAASRMKAAVGETEHEKEVDAARAAGAAYGATHRVCPSAAGRDAGSAPAAAAPGDPGIRESVPDGSVVVSAGDVQACSSTAAYAVALHNWLVDQPNQQ